MSKSALLLVALLAALAALAGCDKPGEGVKADEGYRMARPVIEALENYHQAEGTYPPSLEDLAPAYLPSVPTPQAPSGGPVLEYRQAGEGADYELSFRYVGPGMNVCTYRPGSSWHCYGYY